MYDSRSTHPRTGAHAHRSWRGKSTGGLRMALTVGKHGDFTPKRMREISAPAAIAEGLAETLVIEERDPLDCEWEPNRWEMDAIHKEALAWLEEHEADIAHFESVEFEIEARNDAAFGGYSDDTYLEDGQVLVDCWLPYMRMDELRETFGQNWQGNGFHIISPNARRTK